VIGCDFSAGMLARATARARGERGTRPGGWIQGDALRLPIGNETVDAVVSTEAFHWFPDPAAALCEFHRVLTPGGRLLLAFVNSPLPLVGGLAHVVSSWFGQPLRWPTTRELRGWIEAAGLRVDAQRRIYRVSGFLLPPVLTQAHRP